jgi:competence protein ComEC
MPETLAIKEAFILTMAALTFTLPIMLFNFGQVSILAPFANVAITWTIPIAMLL